MSNHKVIESDKDQRSNSFLSRRPLRPPPDEALDHSAPDSLRRTTMPATSSPAIRQSPSAATLAFRFVWRRAHKKTWHAVTFRAKDVTLAITAMRRHIEAKHGLNLSEVVVDHYFYSVEELACDAGLDQPGFLSSPFSLCELEHPFHVEFKNKVQAPSKPHPSHG